MIIPLEGWKQPCFQTIFEEESTISGLTYYRPQYLISSIRDVFYCRAEAIQDGLDAVEDILRH
jgi:hypothetical protein